MKIKPAFLLLTAPVLLSMTFCVYSQIDPGKSYLIQARHSGNFIRLAQDSAKAGVKLIQGDGEAPNQRFRIVPVGNGYYKIELAGTGNVLDVEGSSVRDGAPILQWPYNGTANQQFIIESVGEGYISIIARHSGRVLDVQGASPERGAPLIQWSRHNGHNQQFRLVPASEPPVSPGGPDLNAYLNSLNKVRAELLRGVRRIAAPGVPGPLLLTSPNAFPIVTATGGNNAELAVVAVSYLGKGRVVAFGHDGFFGESDSRIADTGRLILNSIRWSGGGRDRMRVGLIGSTQLTGLISSGGHNARSVGPADWANGLRDLDVIVAWSSRLSDEQIKILTAFVSAGRGLLAADLGWGWQQLNPGRDLMADNPSNRLLRSAGLSWIDGYAADPPDGYSIKNAVSPYANASIALERMQSISSLPLSERIQVWLAVSQASEVPSYAEKVDRYLLSARNTNGFPGGGFPAFVSRSVPRVSASRTFPAKALNMSQSAWHSTGLYAAPGDVVTVTVDEAAVNKGLNIQIGSHSDKLWHKDTWDRFPDVIRSKQVDAREIKVTSPFGGLIYVTTPGRLSLRDTAFTFRGVIRAPSFEYGKDSLGDWRSRISSYPAPWAELVSDKVVLTLPSETIRQIEDPVALMRFWERVLDLTADLAGISRTREKPERIVTDKQISAGYMHSGYPIMTHLDAAERIANIGQLQTAWGLYHELGHNHQHPDWTFDGTVEVTCNLFTLYVREMATNTSPRKAFMDLGSRPSPEVYFNTQRRLPADQKFGKWKEDPFLALAMYIQLQEAFGWDTYKKVFREYSSLPAREKPKNDAEKRDQWMVRFSKATGYSLARFFDEWGVPVSQEAKRQVAHLPVWMP